MVTTCSPMVGQFFYTMIVASSDKEWLYITTHQNINAGNYFEPPSIKEALHIFWSKPTLNAQVKHVNLKLSLILNYYCIIVIFLVFICHWNLLFISH